MSTGNLKHPWKTALVTGASSGIGEAFASLLGAAGIPTVIVARRRERLDTLAQLHPSLEPIAADLTNRSDRDAVVQRLTSRTLRSSSSSTTRAMASADRSLRRARVTSSGMIDLNINTLTALTRAVLTPMLTARRGWILQVSSVASFQAGRTLVYSATKAFVTSMTEALSVELAGTGVKVSALCPGLTRSEFHEVSGTNAAMSRIPDMAWMESDDVAHAGLSAMATGRLSQCPVS